MVNPVSASALAFICRLILFIFGGGVMAARLGAEFGQGLQWQPFFAEVERRLQAKLVFAHDRRGRLRPCRVFVQASSLLGPARLFVV